MGNVEQGSLLPFISRCCIKVESSPVLLFKVKPKQSLDLHELTSQVLSTSSSWIIALSSVSKDGHGDSDNIRFNSWREVLFLLKDLSIVEVDQPRVHAWK